MLKKDNNTKQTNNKEKERTYFCFGLLNSFSFGEIDFSNKDELDETFIELEKYKLFKFFSSVLDFYR